MAGLRDEDVATRRAAAEAAAAAEPEALGELAGQLMPLLEDPDPATRAAAAEGLSRLATHRRAALRERGVRWTPEASPGPPDWETDRAEEGVVTHTLVLSPKSSDRRAAGSIRPSPPPKQTRPESPGATLGGLDFECSTPVEASGDGSWIESLQEDPNVVTHVLCLSPKHSRQPAASEPAVSGRSVPALLLAAQSCDKDALGELRRLPVNQLEPHAGGLLELLALPGARPSAMQALSRLPADTLARHGSALRRMLADQAPELRACAFRLLNRMGTGPRANENQPCRRSGRLQHPERTSNPDLAHSQAAAALVDLIQNKDHEIRRIALCELSRLPLEVLLREATVPLIGLLGHSDHTVRLASAAALGSLPTEELEGVPAAEVEVTRREDDRLAGAREGVGPDRTTVLDALLDNPDDEVKKIVAEARALIN